MKCPADGATLLMSERQGVEIDYCPDCRGVWLDRGELDKIIERSLTQPGPAPAAPAPPQFQEAPQQQQPYQAQRQPYQKKKRESWLSELFD
jgi:Zn-finger nucleic acid-binding protein